MTCFSGVDNLFCCLSLQWRCVAQVPGSHRYREYRRSHTDDEMAAWISGKTNAAGEPLRMVRQALPPGSLVALLCHCAHSVSPVVARPGQGDENATRWASLFCYRRRATGPARSRWVTQQFEDAAVGGGEGVEGCLSQASDELRRLFRNDGGEADEA